MSQSSTRSSRDGRPDFMVTLGVGPPYVLEDVKRAYLEKAKQAHPDRGGSAAAFHEIQQAFERAQAFMEFRTDRRTWIAARMERYIALQDAIGRLEELGATVVAVAQEWLQNSFGDFAQLTESPETVRAVDAPNGDAIIAALVADHAVLKDLDAVELPGCRVSDDAVLSLAIFQSLKRLDLSRTPVTNRAAAVIDSLPMLETIDLSDSQVGWMTRRRAAARLFRRIAR